MKEIFNKLSSLPLPVGHIVHIGVGQCSELQAYQDLNPQKVILVEADNQQVIQLKKTTQSKKIIDVLATAIFEKEESRSLIILTNQRDSSLLIPEKLLTYYPSLTIANEQAVTTITLEKLLQKYTFNSSFHHLLVIETPGVEGLIVESTSIKKLQQFSGIMIRTSADKLYKEEEQKNIIDFLESYGFDCNHQEDELYSPVFSKLYFQRNNEKIELQHSQEQIKQLISERDTQSKSETEKQSLIEQLTKAKDEQTKLATERQQNVEKITGERDAQSKSAAEKQNQIEQLTEVKNEQTKLATERQQNVEKITGERDAQSKLVTEKKNQIEQQAKTKEQEKSKLTAEHKQKIEQINQEYEKIISDLKHNEDKLQLELDDAKQTVSLSLKLQMLKENDLKDLQQRYQEKAEALPQIYPNNFTRLKERKKSVNTVVEPVVRIIHHFSCTGGTLFSKCLAAQPNVVLLNEVDPFSKLLLNKEDKPKFEPRDILSLMNQAGQTFDDDSIAAIFRGNIKGILENISLTKKVLVLREHTHSAYLLGSSVRDSPLLDDVLKEAFNIKSVITVRNPIDSYLSLKEFGWLHFEPPTFNEYCYRYLCFLDDYKELKIFKYEDFVGNSINTMDNLCAKLDVEFDADFINNFSEYKLSGDSGRSGDVIESRRRRLYSQEFVKEVNESENFKVVSLMLGYEEFIH